jgi:hypothetical protein
MPIVYWDVALSRRPIATLCNDEMVISGTGPTTRQIKSHRALTGAGDGGRSNDDNLANGFVGNPRGGGNASTRHGRTQRR